LGALWESITRWLVKQGASLANGLGCTTLTMFKPHKDQDEIQGRAKNKPENKLAFISLYDQLSEITAIYGEPLKIRSRQKWKLCYVDLASLLNAVIPKSRLTPAQVLLFLGNMPRARIHSDKVIHGFEALLVQLDKCIKKHSDLDMGLIAQQEKTLWAWIGFQF